MERVGFGMLAVACLMVLSGCVPRYQVRYVEKPVVKVIKVQEVKVVKVKQKHGLGHAYGRERRDGW